MSEQTELQQLFDMAEKFNWTEQVSELVKSCNKENKDYAGSIPYKYSNSIPCTIQEEKDDSEYDPFGI